METEHIADVGVDLGNGEKAAAGASVDQDRDFEGSAEEKFDNESKPCTGTYPADCYTFMALHGPFDGNRFFLLWILCLGISGKRRCHCLSTHSKYTILHN